MKVGDNVTYIPFKGCDKSLYESGKVKSICDDTNYVFVVYHCNNNWDVNHWKDYTAARTATKDLKIGWF
jgi:hypothetical protein